MVPQYAVPLSADDSSVLMVPQCSYFLNMLFVPLYADGSSMLIVPQCADDFSVLSFLSADSSSICQWFLCVLMAPQCADGSSMC